MSVPVVGLTGGIASGKSTVARRFAALSVPVVDADAIAREVVLPGTPGLRDIVATFGPSVLRADSTLDRKAMADLVFDDESARARLNAITHPRIAAASSARFAALDERTIAYAMYEAALLVENGLGRAFAALVVVAASPEVQIARLVKRDGIDEERARARIAAQMPLAEKVRVADFVIWNEDRQDALDEKVRAVHADLLKRLSREGIVSRGQT